MTRLDGADKQILIEDSSLRDYSPITRRMLISHADELYSVALDDLSRVKLVEKGNWDGNARWLVDGHRAVFITASRQLAVINFDGTGLFQVTPLGSNPAPLYLYQSVGDRIFWEKGFYESKFAVVTQGTWSINLDGTGLQELGRLTLPEFSPSNRHFAYTKSVTKPGLGYTGLFVVELENGEEIQVWPEPNQQVTSIDDVKSITDPSKYRWSPDGDRLVLGDGKRFVVWSMGNSKYTELPELPFDAYMPIWFPDGKRLLFQTWDDSRRIRFFTVDIMTLSLSPIFENIGLQDGESMYNEFLIP